MGNVIYKWSFLDKKNRGKLWYIITISIVIGISVWGIFTKQYGLSFVVILVSGVIFFIENNSPEQIEVKITELGIKASDSFYDFSKIKNYSFIYNKEDAVFLRLWLNKKGIKNLDLKIDNKICLDLKNILPKYIEESKDGELSWVEKLINFLKL